MIEILCFGDSNTYGFTPDWKHRYGRDIRYPGALQALLGDGYYVAEDGLIGRTAAFADSNRDGRSALETLPLSIESHGPVQYIVLMLGTNDCKERFNANAVCIGRGMERLITKAKTVPAWRNGTPNILIVSPPWMREGFTDIDMGPESCKEKSPLLAEQFARVAREQGCAFLDAEGIAEVGTADYVHLSRRGHARLAGRLAELVPQLV